MTNKQLCECCYEARGNVVSKFMRDENGKPIFTCFQCEEEAETNEYLKASAETTQARALRLAIIQQQYNIGNLTLEESKELLSEPLTPGDETTIFNDSSQLVAKNAPN